MTSKLRQVTMTPSRILPALLGSVAILATATLLVMHILLAQALLLSPSSALMATTIVSSVLEAGVLGLLCWIFSRSISQLSKEHFNSHRGMWFGLFAFVCVSSATVSAGTMVCLSNAEGSQPGTILGSGGVRVLIGASVNLAVAFAMQVSFLVADFVVVRMHTARQTQNDLERGGRRSPQVQIKSIPYSQTSSPVTSRTRNNSVGSATPPGSSGGRSTTETMSSFRSSFSHAVRPISSRTRLISASNSQRSPRRPSSLDLSSTYRDRTSTGEDAFDSWDTSTVDPQNRQTVLLTSGSGTGKHLLETIPASPTTSRSPSPGMPLDLDPPAPARARRSRSYSPASTRARSHTVGLTQHSSTSESHIHPLFRSDSPTPPPVAKPGTVVIAAPNAGQLIASDAQSIRSLSTRMRSGSMPQASSPLSRQSSFEDAGSLRWAGGASPRDNRRLAELQLREEDEENEDEKTAPDASADEERQLTPTIPDIPDWILTAGSRTSLHRYNSRLQRANEDEKE